MSALFQFSCLPIFVHPRLASQQGTAPLCVATTTLTELHGDLATILSLAGKRRGSGRMDLRDGAAVQPAYR
jgi:hypothetical protein